MVSVSKQDFLKNLYKQKEKGEEITSSSFLADMLNVSNAAISDMSKKLSNDGLIHYKPYKGLVLTSSGEREALKVLRRHRLWEMFLVTTLGMDWSEVHQEAENLEHLSSEQLMDKIDAFLGFPDFDPHGSPIPDKKGKIPDSPVLILMVDAIEGKKYKIARVTDRDNRVVKYLGKLGLGIGVRIEIKDKFDFDDSINILVEGKEIMLSDKMSRTIYLELIK
ncbi:MAG TPA: metal-dependent transcriptional regulator [Bacteroidetes bacterium]|nr:metal-dependent transcriptional regulator [Bacteroidota bacterium]